MADPAARPIAAGSGEGGGGGGYSVGTLVRYGVMWLGLNAIIRGALGPPPGGNDVPARVVQRGACVFEPGTHVDVELWASEEESYAPWEDDDATRGERVASFRDVALEAPPRAAGALSLGALRDALDEDATGVAPATDTEYAAQWTYRPSDAVRLRNATLYLHAFVSRTSGSPHTAAGATGAGRFEADEAFRVRAELTRRVRRRRARGTKSLLGGGGGEEEGGGEVDEGAPAEVVADGSEDALVSHWRPNLTLALVHGMAEPLRAMAPAVAKRVRPVPGPNELGEYFPVAEVADFWVLRDHLIEINASTEELPTQVRLQLTSNWWWQLEVQMEESWKMQQAMGTMREGEEDTFKRLFVETNPYLLAVTMTVSLLHSLFDMLAFTADVSFWRKRRNLRGLSVRSVVSSAACNGIIFLYLLDNDTSWMVLMSNGLGLIIDAWKVTKAVNVRFCSRALLGGALHVPWVRLAHREGYVHDETMTHDRVAAAYCGTFLYPMVAGFAVQSLIYSKFASWWSWVLTALVRGIYALGFTHMVPQLYINYKLRSVAHLPWKQLSYKFFNTIIDDLFAFCIKMPPLHRLSVFRDDAVFLVFLVQWYLYGVDKKRVNEFGYVEVGPQVGPQASGQAALEGGGDAGAADVDTPQDSRGRPSEGETVRKRR